ncbi:hypothetical protein PBRA_009675, partial [Plasmodiophora brassicae]
MTCDRSRRRRTTEPAPPSGSCMDSTHTSAQSQATRSRSMSFRTTSRLRPGL